MDQVHVRRIRQIFDGSKLADPVGAVSSELARIGLSDRVKPGMRIGVTAGSRGIANISSMIKRIAEEVKQCGGEPFVLAAMGSHGGGTPEGQQAVLAGYGITEESIGAPIVSSMDVVELGRLQNGLQVYFDRTALESDGIIVVNRVKAHTAFKSDIESGLCKMISVGLGNHEGARLVHSLGVPGLMDYMVQFAALILSRAPIVCGLGILENAYDQTRRIKAGGPDEIMEIDRELLREWKQLMPKLPVSRLDVLFIREIGKNISGTGMDTNVVGGVKGFKPGEYTPPEIKKIIIEDISAQSKGNALGMGIADLITRKAYDKIDFKVTYTNSVTATFLDRAKLPMVAETDREAFELALNTCWNPPGVLPRVVVLKNTLKLDEMYVSKSIWEEIAYRPEIEAVSDWEELSFDAEGELMLSL
jgi:hypothetical protein